MGLYFNTAATTEMVKKVNDQFNSGNISFWRNFQRRKLFGPDTDGKPLSSIAGGNAIYPSDGATSTKGRKWFKWLSDIQTGAGSAGDQISALLFKHLGIAKCAEIVFTVGPTTGTTAIVTDRQVALGGGKYSERINIDTPTAATIRAAIKRKMESRKGPRKKKKA